MLSIDGSQGEGGGQILRSSLTLSMITGTPFRIDNIRAGRKKSGLLRQHLTCVLAAKEISGAEVEGAELRSGALVFRPGAVRPGDYEFSVGSAGSTSLVLQTVLPALVFGETPSTVAIHGGTHNPTSPPFEFLTDAFFPLLARMGAHVSGQIRRHGFYPAGGGHVVYTIQPAKPQPIDVLERGRLRRKRIVACVATLPSDVGAREVTTLATTLGWNRDTGSVKRVQSPGPGNTVSVFLECDHVTEVFTGFGEKGVRAEAVANAVAKDVSLYIKQGVPIGPHLADQLLLWLALAGGGSFRTLTPTEHTHTHAHILRAFLGVSIDLTPSGSAYTVRVKT